MAMGKAEREARRIARSGSGPTNAEPGANPGASGAFALLGEVLLVGIIVTFLGLPLVTLPAALAAGIRHLRRFARADGSPYRALWRDFLRALPAGLAVGAGAVVLAGVLALDIVLAGSGALPGGGLIATAGWVVAALAGGALVLAAGLWSPDLGWAGALRALPTAVGADPAGAAYHAIAAAFVALAGWMLVPLVVPAIGCATLAAAAVPQRPRRRTP
ncbi:hypothetical protein [Microbacterium excoecariae]|uniref:hypothetical protein n=1 Tax=Microbacterium excoecariae TaxID=2715210 RepID=UPI00140BCC6C|nr:hypothetical protein [Microbacterium excoecariae]NHI15692.1 hypothetical protein [Microbacterium excoecariae]